MEMVENLIQILNHYDIIYGIKALQKIKYRITVNSILKCQTQIIILKD